MLFPLTLASTGLDGRKFLLSEAINEILVVGEVVSSEVLSLGEDVSFGKIITPLESFIEGVRSIDDIATFVSFVVSAERAK